jgi:hypothetical protein
MSHSDSVVVLGPLVMRYVYPGAQNASLQHRTDALKMMSLIPTNSEVQLWE